MLSFVTFLVKYAFKCSKNAKLNFIHASLLFNRFLVCLLKSGIMVKPILLALFSCLVFVIVFLDLFNEV